MIWSLPGATLVEGEGEEEGEEEGEGEAAKGKTLKWRDRAWVAGLGFHVGIWIRFWTLSLIGFLNSYTGATIDIWYNDDSYWLCMYTWKQGW